MKVIKWLSLFAGTAYGLSLSYMFQPHEPRACFYIDIPHTSSELTVYFAVEDGEAKGEVDMTVYGPHHAILNTLRRQSHNEIKIRPTEGGEHSVCFSHSSSYKLQVIDIDVSLQKLEGHPDLKKDETSGPQDPAAQLAKKLEVTGENLQRDLTDLLHTLRHLRNREKRNLETVLSISSHIFGFSLLEMMLIVGMSTLQVIVMKSLFTSTGKMRV